MSVKSLIYDERNFVEKKIKQHNKETTITKKKFFLHAEHSFMHEKVLCRGQFSRLTCFQRNGGDK